MRTCSHSLAQILTFASLVVFAGTQAVAADEAEAFYKGRQVSIIVGHEAGTGFDLYARTLAKFMPSHVPGKPTIVVQNMTGASGLNSLNFLANVAPKDGSMFATMVFSAPFEPLMGARKGQFDATRFLWIGNMDSSVSVFGVSRKSGVRSFDELFKKEIIVGATGGSGPLNQIPNALKNLLSAKIKVIPGYKGSASIKIAIQRGELDGAAAISWSTVKTQYQDIVKDGNFHMILQLGPEPHPDLATVPHVYAYARNEDDRKIFDLVFGVQGLGRAFMAPEGIPAERGAALRKAFMATMADSGLLAEANRIKLDIRPQSGEEVEAFVKRLYGFPKNIVALARNAVKGEGDK